MAAFKEIYSDNQSSTNQPGEVDFVVNKETASQYLDKLSSKSFFRLDLSNVVTRKAKYEYSHHYHCLHLILARKIMLLSPVTAKAPIISDNFKCDMWKTFEAYMRIKTSLKHYLHHQE